MRLEKFFEFGLRKFSCKIGHAIFKIGRDIRGAKNLGVVILSGNRNECEARRCRLLRH